MHMQGFSACLGPIFMHFLVTELSSKRRVNLNEISCGLLAVQKMEPLANSVSSAEINFSVFEKVVFLKKLLNELVVILDFVWCCSTLTIFHAFLGKKLFLQPLGPILFMNLQK
jgi:hypothetical protein